MSERRATRGGGMDALNRLALLVSGRQDLAIAGVLIAAAMLMVLPVPTPVVDVLIGCNIGLAVLLLMVAVYLSSPLDFYALPGVILISTLFRLALAVTTTRLILVQADAGEIVETFGEFVIAGNVVVGLVVFLIITIVQFVVVTKGSERVAEVGARFTLDALPGKQMSIDADLRSGDIDQAEARRRRRVVERESQFHGAMDGAMKFVKGDAIAGLIIIAVNLLGGLGIGTVQRGLPLGEALHTYTLLTIGDALVSQLPALFLSITAAVIVTRVSGDSGGNLGSDIVGQIASDRRALRLAAAVLLGMALVPGFPKPVFLLLALAFGAASLERKGTRGGAVPGGSGAEEGTPARPAAPPRPVMVRLAPHLAAAVELGRLERLVGAARGRVGDELGIACPETGITEDAGLEGMRYSIEVDGVPIEEGEGRPGSLLLRDDPVHLDLAGVEAETGPPVLGTQPASWVDAAHRARLQDAGIGFSDCAQVIVARAREVLRKHAPASLGIQETKALLGRMERDYADLVREVARVLPAQKVADVLRRLLDEGVPVRNMRAILEALAEWAEREPRPVMLAEYVRAALARQICHRYANAQKVLPAWILEHDAEQAVRAALHETAMGIYLALDAPTSDRIVEAVRRRHAKVPPGQTMPVLVTSMDVRRYVRALLVKNGVDVPVLSYQDLAPGFPVQPVGSIRLDAAGERAPQAVAG